MFFYSDLRRSIVCVVLVLGFCATPKCESADPAGSATTAASAQAASASPVKKYALLVGCTKYINHDAWELQGPANDVDLLRSVLKKDQFDFQDPNIVTLVEANDAEHRPTKTNIEREFGNLAKEARTDDQVVILLSGHGSTQPEKDSPNPLDHKLDGMDEMFLPADTGSWNKTEQSVTNVILDHELRHWLDAITETGAHVWVIVDSCHSGTMARGTDAEKSRDVEPEKMLVPREAIIAAKVRAHERAKSGDFATAGSGQALPLALSGGHMKNRVGLYAAQATEPAPEMPLPDGEKDARPQGLLTYTLCELLTPKAEEGRPAITYRELGERIRQRYAAMNRAAPTPLVEGGDLNREVLGMKEWPGRSRIVLTQDRAGQWRITAGTLLGLNSGSVLAVYDTNNASDEPVGYVKVTDVGITSSAVTPYAYGKLAINEKLTPGSRCELAFVDLGSRPLKLAVADGLRQALAPLEQDQGSLIQLVADAQSATWHLQVEGQKCYLVPGSGVLQRQTESSDKSEEGPLFGPFDSDPKTLLSVLKERLGRIAQAQALINLADQPAAEGELDRTPDSVGIEIEMLRFKDTAAKTADVLHSGAEIKLHAGDRITFRMTNTGKRFKVYPALLFIDSGYGILPIYPEEGEIVEALNPGESFTAGALRVNAKTVGKEQLVVIAVKAAGPPADFSGFAQPTLERERGEDAMRGEAMRTPLGQLLEQALYNVGTTRGIEPAQIGESALAHIVWQTEPEEK